MSVQTAWPGPRGAQLSGSASHSSTGGGGGGASITGSAPLDAQRHATLFAAAQAYTDEPPSVELELDDRCGSRRCYAAAEACNSQVPCMVEIVASEGASGHACWLFHVVE